ncbi:hypothetical protein ACIQC7_27800 [Kitasatospora sp. NPDC088556]|uniref:hypothetical protein n=1 Tax=Kitasatospora sp. NPDC088556 TaxID=3364076 RepID=UPI00382E87D0
MSPNLATILACSPLAAYWSYRIATARRIPMPELPDDLGVTPATDTQPAILWARHGKTIRFYAVPGTQQPQHNTQWHTHLPTEEDQP